MARPASRFTPKPDEGDGLIPPIGTERGIKENNMRVYNTVSGNFDFTVIAPYFWVASGLYALYYFTRS